MQVSNGGAWTWTRPGQPGQMARAAWTNGLPVVVFVLLPLLSRRPALADQPCCCRPAVLPPTSRAAHVCTAPHTAKVAALCVLFLRKEALLQPHLCRGIGLLFVQAAWPRLRTCVRLDRRQPLHLLLARNTKASSRTKGGSKGEAWSAWLCSVAVCGWKAHSRCLSEVRPWLACLSVGARQPTSAFESRSRCTWRAAPSAAAS